MDSVFCCRPVRVHSGVLRLLLRGVAVYNIVRCGGTGFTFGAPGSSPGPVTATRASVFHPSFFGREKARPTPGLWWLAGSPGWNSDVKDS